MSSDVRLRGIIPVIAAVYSLLTLIVDGNFGGRGVSGLKSAPSQVYGIVCSEKPRAIA